MNQSQVTLEKLEEVKEEVIEGTSPLYYKQKTTVTNKPSSIIEDEYAVQQTFIEESVAYDVIVPMSPTVIKESITDHNCPPVVPNEITTDIIEEPMEDYSILVSQEVVAPIETSEEPVVVEIEQSQVDDVPIEVSLEESKDVISESEQV